MPFHDPFADPVGPRITVSQPMPIPEPYQVEDPPQPQLDPLDTQSRGIILPLAPPVHQVIPERSLHGFPSTQSLLGSNDGGRFETNERLPLLSRQGSPKGFSYLQPSSHSVVNVNISAPSPTTTAPKLHDLGWIEYQLPDGTVYYVHPTRRVTANIDLRDDTKLDAVTAYFGVQGHTDGAGAPAGVELWLREDELQRTHGGFRPVRFWVNHLQRTVARDQPAVNGDAAGKKKKRAVEDDQLDAEYRYWAFVEAHPAHAALPPNARVEATDVLTWAWTDRLLPSHRSVPAPFTQEECQELMSLLRSFEQGENGLQTVVQTRIIARILLRVAQWRQQHFRPNKPPPTDVGIHNHGLPRYRKPLRRALVDLLISCLCLGLPYLFFERGRFRIDEESGVRSGSPGPMFLVGACTCLVAAIVLSASVTFLSLPGLDNFARVAGFVAILFATFSMASTVVALFRYKADLERPVSHVAGEGLLMLSRRSVVLSLPLVFLIYAIVAFVTGIVLYSFRGVTDPFSPEQRFEDYTRWTVVGVLGGLAGMLTTSLLLLRR
ncbi:hypothetical protein DXG03_001816 [Asterophora parasitica]|uniref:Uncharacterized protein n=1 Tax=Asterophora parasitica TaxID=117018 RepID=A0A9P7G3M0_9AGAR|nr:hypothetical protein DXG03_001816 [Asterophora parasitica]